MDCGINWNPVEEFQIENIYMTLSRNFLPKRSYISNPTSGVIKIANASISKWKIFNLHGQLIQNGNTNWIDLSDQENGLYILQLGDINIQSTLTIIKK